MNFSDLRKNKNDKYTAIITAKKLLFRYILAFIFVTVCTLSAPVPALSQNLTGTSEADKTTLMLLNLVRNAGVLTQRIEEEVLPMNVSPKARAGGNDLKGTVFNKWVDHLIPTETGAMCGDGSPYRFFSYQKPKATNTVILFEGGGACTDEKSCASKDSELGAKNPNGIPKDYLKNMSGIGASIAAGPILWNATQGHLDVSGASNNAAASTARQVRKNKSPTSASELKSIDGSWNLIYLPYCTGDVHLGNTIVQYGNRIQHHVGFMNIKESLKIIARKFAQPTDLVVFGYSAGAVAATIHYDAVRREINPSRRSTLIADSGPIFPADLTATHTFSIKDMTTTDYNPVRDAIVHSAFIFNWGLGEKDGILRELRRNIPDFRAVNLGSIYGAIAKKYPNDRFLYSSFQKDAYFSRFLYEQLFHTGYVLRESSAISIGSLQALAKSYSVDVWEKAIKIWASELMNHKNISYYFPFGRDALDSHCLSVVDFSATKYIHLNSNLSVHRKTVANIPGQDYALAINEAIMRGSIRKLLEDDGIIQKASGYAHWAESSQGGLKAAVIPTIKALGPTYLKEFMDFTIIWPYDEYYRWSKALIEKLKFW